MCDMCFIFRNMEAKEIRHMVIGHSQIRNFKDYQFPDIPDINFPMETICIRGGKAPELINIIKDELHTSKTPLRISAIIWQNSNWDITISEVERLVFDMETYLKDYPFHRVAFPECLFVPEQERIWDKIAKINAVLADYNHRQGFDRYPLYKVAQTYCKRKGSSTVRQTSYLEFNRGLTQTGSNNSNKGYHLDEGAPKKRFAKFVRTFHSKGFHADSKTKDTGKPQESISNKVFCVANPGNIMRSPGKVDARTVINSIRQRNQTTIKTDEVVNATEEHNTEEEHEVAQTQQNDDLQEDMKKWITHGMDTGFFNFYEEAVKERVLKQIDEASANRKRQQEDEPTCSKAGSKRIKLAEKPDKTSSTKSKSIQAESNSSTESDSSGDEMRISKTTLIKKMQKTIKKLKAKEKKKKKYKERKKKYTKKHSRDCTESSSSSEEEKSRKRKKKSRY